MGGAFYRGLSKIFPPGSLFICDRHAEKLKALGAKHCGSDPNKILKDAQTVILAVKPQSFSEFCQNLRVSLSKKLIISIMAGIGISTLRKKLSAAGLRPKAEILLRILSENPYQKYPPFEKLVGDLAGAYSRRINIQHRLVYQVLNNIHTVKVLRMWTHYE